MGHHASKHKHKTGIQSTTAKVGTNSSKSPTGSAPSSTLKSKSGSKPTIRITSKKSQFTKESRPLGSKDENDHNNVSLNAKEASAKAAEERFQKLQGQKSGQRDRLRDKAKQSKNDKGL
ncbi:conserved hypothetical protein [Candida dubliniensis CD36]|uniref:Uncharacterized protein n=1 Tax=Candida dubliniensis (strain CD36 / ATCC MYA-646 / CBS 7987 / NCPF 3949 / NRRL Y-17841) TaxID=573826 RepID=B9WEP9_CANDC|nr:conserved hypothetical protein [Candida dubliniensis CD36]CAX43161.1 conserved hypothetical protein [Candida dubliniensis CD36]